jgi:hypothetical protein
MKARRIAGLDPEAPLRDNARRIVGVRLDELCSFVPRALDEQEVKALHDMRIAAKRLRYVLELTGFCFGPYAARAGREARALQDAIGEIHDCDMLAPRIMAHLADLRAADSRALAHSALRRGGSLRRLSQRKRSAYGALEGLLTDEQARRAVLFEQFRRRWTKLERGGFREKLLAALEEPSRGDGA